MEVEYDALKTDYSSLLDLFWKNHNPTVPSPPQYKSVIYYYNEEQKEMAEESLKVSEGVSDSMIMTL